MVPFLSSFPRIATRDRKLENLVALAVFIYPFERAKRCDTLLLSDLLKLKSSYLTRYILVLFDGTFSNAHSLTPFIMQFLVSSIFTRVLFNYAWFILE